MGFRKQKKAKGTTAKDAKGAIVKTKPHCVGCFCADPLVDLHLQEDTYAELLFDIRENDVQLACVSCAFHAELVSQLRCALQDSLRRPAVSCLVCRASGQLFELRSVEGAQEALGLELLETKHISRQVTPTKQVCTACAYALQWLYNRSFQNNQAKLNLPEAGPSRNLKVAMNRVDEKNIISGGRATRKAAANPEPAKKPNTSSRPTRGAQRAAPAPPPPDIVSPRRLRKRAIVDLTNSESEEEEEADSKRRRVVATNRNIPPKVMETKSRKIVPPARLTYEEKREPIPKITIKLGKNAAIKREQRVVARSARNSTEIKVKKVPERVSHKVHYETQELTEYECEECSQIFYSGVSAELHKLEHVGRFFTLKLTRCKVPEDMTPDSPTSMEDMPVQSSDDETLVTTEVRRKPRKSQSPKKNAAKDRLKADSDTNSNFVFVAPLRVVCPKEVQNNKHDEKAVEFGFEKPIIVTPATKENVNDFSDEEVSDTENIDKCITSLESNEQEADADGATIEDKKTAPLSEEQQNGITDKNVGELPTENCASETNITAEINNEQPETTEKTASSVFVDGYLDNEPPGSIKQHNIQPDNTPAITPPASPNKSVSINSILSFDFEAPVMVKPSKARYETTKSSTETKLQSTNSQETAVPSVNLCGSFESASNGDDFVNGGCSDLASDISSAISDNYNQDGVYVPNNEPVAMLPVGFDTSHALRDDSSNPTLPQSHPREPSYPFSPPDMNHIEKLVSEVVGDN